MKRFSWKDYERATSSNKCDDCGNPLPCPRHAGSQCGGAAIPLSALAVPLNRLAIGDTFVIVGLESTLFELLRLGIGSASVRRCGTKREQFEPTTGKNVGEEVAFDKPYDPARISLTTTVRKAE